MAEKMISNLVLFHYPLSRSLRVVWLLNEFNVEFELKRMKLMAGEGYSEEFTRINPNHTVPALQYTYNGNTHVIIESSAIVRFLVSADPFLPKKQTTPLNPRPERIIPSFANGADVVEIAEFEQWFMFVSVTVDGVLWQFRTIDDFRKRPEEKALLEMYIERWNTIILPQLESRFADGREFVMKSGFTIVDIILIQNLIWAKKYKYLNEWSPALVQYLKRLVARPAIQAAMSDKHLFEKDSVL